MSPENKKQGSIGIFTTDADFIVRVWDSALAAMTGVPTETARNRPLVDIIPDLDRRGLLARFERVLAAGTVEMLAPAFHRFLIACPPQSASEHFTEMRQRVTIAPLKANNLICGVMVTIEDVTARMEREIELNKQLKDPDAAVRLRAAKAISREETEIDRQSAESLISALGDRNWRVRRELTEGFARRAAPEAIAALLQAVKEHHYDFGMLNSALRVLQATSIETTETLIEFLAAGDADLRMQAALLLGEQKNPQAIPALLAALGDQNTNVRYHAIEALGKLRAGEALEPLLGITETRDFFLSFAALDALRQIADHSVAGRLLPLLDDELLREAALETLGAIGDREIVPVLIDLINRDDFPVAAAGQAVLAVYARYANDSPDAAEVIKLAQHTLNPRGKENLLAALNESAGTDLPTIIELAGWFGDERIGRRLAAFLERDSLLDTAAAALVRHGAAATEALIEKLDSDDARARQAAVRLLGNIKKERAATVLLEILETDSELEADAALALGQSGDGRALEPLIALLRTGAPVARQMAVEGLKMLAVAETVNRLSEHLTDSDPNIREAAIRVVGHFGAKGCENEILQAAEDANERVQKAAIDQLVNISDERKISLLIRLLREGAPRIRTAAAQNLAHEDRREAAAALRGALNDPDSWVRYFATRSLGHLKDAESREKLIDISANDPAEHVRLAAHEVLGELTK